VSQSPSTTQPVPPPAENRPAEPASRLSGGVVPIVVIVILAIAVAVRRQRQRR
jgi:hypothetical protein